MRRQFEVSPKQVSFSSIDDDGHRRITAAVPTVPAQVDIVV